MNLLCFIFSAWLHKCAYIDMDGCLFKRMRCPLGMGANAALAWWGANLAPTPIIRRRLVLLYMLRLLGVRLYIWTNRWPQHKNLTRQALGRHAWLFDPQWLFFEGAKQDFYRCGPCMDDQKKYVGTKYADLLVKQL